MAGQSLKHSLRLAAQNLQDMRDASCLVAALADDSSLIEQSRVSADLCEQLFAAMVRLYLRTV